jgi:two-component system KDP operon response regulator KdpE
MQRFSAMVADEDSSTLRFVRANLRASGYEVASAVSGQEVLERFESVKPDVLVVEMNFSDMGGLELCQNVRTRSDVPLVMCSETRDVQTVVDVLNAGADDYIVKPFAIEELLARVNAVIRRSKNKMVQFSSDHIKIGNLIIDLAQRQVSSNGQTVHLTPTEFQLLVYLVNHADKVVPHEELLTMIWGNEYQKCTHYLRVSIGRLRQKIETDLGNSECIVTCSGVGYMMRSVHQF